MVFSTRPEQTTWEWWQLGAQGLAGQPVLQRRSPRLTWSGPAGRAQGAGPDAGPMGLSTHWLPGAPCAGYGYPSSVFPLLGLPLPHPNVSGLNVGSAQVQQAASGCHRRTLAPKWAEAV